MEQEHAEDWAQRNRLGRVQHALGNEPAPHVSRQTEKPERTHCSFAYSALASFRMATLGSASFHSVSLRIALPMPATPIASPEPARSGQRPL